MKTSNDIWIGDTCSYEPLGIVGTLYSIKTHIAGCETVTLTFENTEGKIATTEVDSFLLKLVESRDRCNDLDFDTSVKTGDVIIDSAFNLTGFVTSVTHTLEGETIIQSTSLDTSNGINRDLYNLASSVKVLTDHPIRKMATNLLKRERPKFNIGDKVNYPLLNINGVVLSIMNHINGTQHIEMSTNADLNFQPVICDAELFEAA
ncbi:hypothetical protein [Vibrio owensii]|uniref:hypothetical protein n=1 Tax=Vibrio owensii TaxID=696485 RepID=UPI0018F11D64|nr:hypothetical protein [Vibrio owensii]